MKTLARRLKPGHDLYTELEKIAQEESLEAAVVLSAVGSLSEASLRFADQQSSTMCGGPLEIVSVTGTVSRHGLHVHVSVAGYNGKTIGGHLTAGSKVYTTVELVLLDLSQNFVFERAFCTESKFEELLVREISEPI